ncbi:MAG: HEAT repeat domain-containing protein [Bacteroidales bacterium]|nr:HEAT repeat domain-containing protein [Bacteroidales bacterium]
MKILSLIILSFLPPAFVVPYDYEESVPYGNSSDTTFLLAALDTPPPLPALDFEVSEIKVTGFITSGANEYPVQLGAFRLKINAEAFLNEVLEYIDRNAIMMREDGLYKVRITEHPEPRNVRALSHITVQEKEVEPTEEQRSPQDSIPRVLESADTLSAQTFYTDTTGSFAAVDPVTGKILILGSDNPWLRRIQYFGKSIAFVNALIITIIISLGSMLVLLLIILLNRRRMEREARLHQYLLEKYQGLIVDYLFGTASADDFRLIASDNYRRQVLIDQMIDVSVNLKGDEAKKLTGLYKHLGLDRDSIDRANDRRWHKKIKGFRELAFMNIKDANEAINKALNSSNEILRMEAQIALVRLGDDEPFEFLSHLVRPFSLWEQITLHELMIQHDIKIPPFKKWLASPNYTVVMFALRMIREFRQGDAEDQIREVLLHPEPVVRQLAVQVAGDLEMRSTLDVMKHMYKNQDYNICLEIIRSMGKMPDLSMLGFLKLVLDKEDDVQLQIEATKAIENNGEEGVKTLVKLMKSEYKNYNIIVRHVLDRRIF